MTSEPPEGSMFQGAVQPWLSGGGQLWQCDCKVPISMCTVLGHKPPMVGPVAIKLDLLK